MSCIWPQGIWHGETPQWCPALQDCKHCHCHTPAGLAVRRRRARCSACWAVWLHWHQPCRQSWSDWHHSVRKKFEVHLEHWFISTLFFGTSILECNLTKISMVPLEILVVIPRAWKKEVFSGPSPVFCAGTVTSQGAMAPARAAAGTWS